MLRVVHIESGTIAAQHKLSLLVHIQLVYGQVAHALYPEKMLLLTIKVPQSMPKHSQPDMSLPIYANITQSIAHLLVVEIVSHHFLSL